MACSTSRPHNHAKAKNRFILLSASWRHDDEYAMHPKLPMCHASNYILFDLQVTVEILKRYLEMEANFFLKLVWGIQGEQ